MLDALIEKSKESAETRLGNPQLLARMETASKGQAPAFFIVSSIRRCVQDAQLLSIQQGDAFWATRFPGLPLKRQDLSPFLFGGPAAYSSRFHQRTGVVATFESAERDDVVLDTLSAIRQNESLKGLPIVGLRVDYELGRVRLVVHSMVRNYVLENSLLRRIVKPSTLDERMLVLMCSDSRLVPPATRTAVPMAIRTLGAFLPSFSGVADETSQLNTLLFQWLEKDAIEKKIIIVAHGSATEEHASCGASRASLEPSEVSDKLLRSVVERIGIDATRQSKSRLLNPEAQAMAIIRAAKENLLEYPVFVDLAKKKVPVVDLILLARMDTVTNVLTKVQ